MRNLPRVAFSLAPAAVLAAAMIVAPAHAAEPAPKSATAPATQAKGSPKSEEQALRTRVKEYWDAKVADSPKVFDYYLPPEKGGADRGRISEGQSITYGSSRSGCDDRRGCCERRDQPRFPSSCRRRSLPDSLKHPKIVDRWRRTEGIWYRADRAGPLEALAEAGRVTREVAGAGGAGERGRG
jgi:hypothetical protein